MPLKRALAAAALALTAAGAAAALTETASPPWALLLDAALLGAFLPYARRAWAWLLPAAGLGHFFLAPPAPSAVLVVVDCLRADRLGVMAGVSAHAREGVHFQDVSAQSSWTRSSVASLLTGVWPARHGLLRLKPEPDRLQPELPTLADAFLQAGWTTAAFAEQAQLDPAFGLDRGFLHYRYHEGEAARLIRHYRRWDLVYRHVPRFVYLHFLDAHHPYEANSPLPSFVPSDPKGWSPFLRQIREGQLSPSPEEWAQLSAAYDAELAALDALLAPLLAGERGFVALTGDHGEAFGEHGMLTHGQIPYEELLRIPLVLWGPGLSPATVARPVARQVDVGPTLLSLSGLPPMPSDGRDLSPLTAGGSLEELPSYAEYADAEGHFVSVRLGPYKMIRGAGADQLFDLSADPGERGAPPADNPELQARLSALLDAYQALSGGSAPSEVEAGTWDALRALGYVE